MGKTGFDLRRDMILLDRALEIECPEYDGNRLDEVHVYYVLGESLFPPLVQYSSPCGCIIMLKTWCKCRQLRARRALSILKDSPLRTRRVRLLYSVFSDSTLLLQISMEHIWIEIVSFWLSADQNILFVISDLYQVAINNTRQCI